MSRNQHRGKPLGAGFDAALAGAREHFGRFNLVVIGRTGAGKSTLINAVFGAAVAATGTGEPVTHGLTLHISPDGLLGLYDAEGFETGQGADETLAWLRRTVRRNWSGREADRIHAVWYCVNAADRRLEPAQQEFIRTLATELGLPVVLVMTQVPARRADPGAGGRGGRSLVPHPQAVEFARYLDGLRLPVVEGRVFLTAALADPFTAAQAHGVEELVGATFRCAPQDRRDAFTAAQRVDQDAKARAARRWIKLATASAAATGATPIPVADAAVLVPVQTIMMARIAVLYGIELPRATLAAAAATAATTQAGRFTVGALLKLVPGAGAVVGGTISAATGAAITALLGETWRTLCALIAAGGVPEEVWRDPGRLQDLFVETLRRTARRGNRKNPTNM